MLCMSLIMIQTRVFVLFYFNFETRDAALLNSSTRVST